MNRNLGIVLLLAAVGVAGCSSPERLEAEAAAVAAAGSWLALVDAGQYAESWSEAAPSFKAAVPKDQWLETMTASRKPFGRNVSRTLASKRYLKALPGAPDGQYVLIQFRAAFEDKASALETVTPMLCEGGTWRVSGYFVK